MGFLLLALGVVALWWQMEGEERRRVALETQVTSEQMRLRLEAWVDARVTTVSHLALDHAVDSNHSPEEFREDVEELLLRFPGFQAINWVSVDGIIVQVVPTRGNEAAKGKNLFQHPDPHVAEALRGAMESGTVRRTPPVSLLQGGKGIGAYWPTYDSNDQLIGFVNAVFRIETLIDTCFSEDRLKRDFIYAIEELGGEEAYSYGAIDRLDESPYEHETMVRIVDKPWRLLVCPSPVLLQRAHLFTDEIILVMGLCLAMAVAFLMQTILVRQQALQESESQIRLLLNSTGEAFLGVDARGYCTFSNAACAKMLGCPDVEELLGSNMHEILHGRFQDNPECSKGDCPLLSPAAIQENPNLDEIQIAKMDGTTFLAELSAYPIVRGGRTQGMVIVFVDCTERRAMEVAQRRSEELFRAITENSSDITLIVSKDGRYQYVSPAMEDLIGLPPSDFLGKTAAELGHIHPEDVPMAAKATVEAWQHPKQPIPAPPIRVKRTDGSWAYIENNYTALPGVPGVDGLVVHCREVTERVLAEEQIRASKQMLRLVLDSIPVRVFWKDREFRFLGCNAAFAADAGIASPEEIVGKSDLDMPWRADAKAYRLDDAEVLDSGSAKLQIEESQVRSDGQVRWLRTSKVPLLDLEGEIVGVMGCYEDITESRAAAQALRESEENYRILVEGASELIFVVHESGEVLLANPPAAALMGHTPESIGGKKLQELLPKERATERMQVFQHTIATGREIRGESVESFEGVESYYNSSVKPLKNNEGQFDRVLVIASDITERRRSEKALQEGEARYRLLADNVTDVIWTIDLAMNLTYVSPSVKSLVGYSIEELASRKVQDFIAPQDFERIRRAVTEELAKGIEHSESDTRYRTMELRIRHKNGGHVWTESTTTILRDASGKPVGVQGSTRDITQRKEIEAEKANLEHQLRQSQKMEAVGTLAGGIAHDFNNLLTGVLGYANLLKLTSEPGEEVYEAADVIEKAADRAAQLTRQLLGFARKGKLQDAPVDVHKVVQEVITLLARTLNKNIDIAQRLRATACFAKGDPTQIQQVVLNLAVNARDAMPDGGQLTFQTDNLTITPESSQRIAGLPDGDYLVLTVSDTGVGIPDDIQDRVFEPFFTTKEQGKGTGMGLATVYGIVKNHGGVVQIASSSDKVTTFCSYLPVAEVPLTEVPAEPDSDNGLIPGTGRIMVVDDESVVRNLASSMLKELGYEVVTFEDPVAAVAFFEEHASDIGLVIVDMVMPLMNGRECFEALKKRDPGIPVILSSGYGQDTAIQETMRGGLSGFVQKPYRLKTLSNAVAAAIRSTEASGPPKQG